MFSSMMEAVKMNPFVTPFSSAKCQGQEETKSLVANRNIAAASVPEGGKISSTMNNQLSFILFFNAIHPHVNFCHVITV